jgi:Ca-activated chloride channel homolog
MLCPTEDTVRKYEGARRRQGSIAMLALVLVIAMLSLGALMINLAYIQMLRAEQQMAADVAVRAATRRFMFDFDLAAAQATAQQVATANRVGNRNLDLSQATWDVGTSLRGAGQSHYVFTPGGQFPNSLRLTVDSRAATGGGFAPLLPWNFGSQPQPIRTQSVATQIELDIALVVDRSGSMAFRADQIAALPPGWTSGAPLPDNWTFGDPAPPDSRWIDLVQGVQVFIDQLDQSPSQELLALITYSDGAGIDRQLSLDYPQISAALDVYSQSFASGATNIGAGISRGRLAVGNRSTSRPGAGKVIVLMTDGLNNRGGDPRHQARAAANQGIMIFTISFALEADQSMMRQIAEIGGGFHVHATDQATLSAAFREIARRLPSLITQ